MESLCFNYSEMILFCFMIGDFFQHTCKNYNLILTRKCSRSKCSFGFMPLTGLQLIIFLPLAHHHHHNVFNLYLIQEEEEALVVSHGKRILCLSAISAQASTLLMCSPQLKWRDFLLLTLHIERRAFEGT